MNKVIHRSQESANTYIADYLKFGIQNRVVAASALLEGFADCLPDIRRLRGAKIYVEYAGAIDELFVFLYAIKMQNDTKEAVFLDTLIHYNSQELNEFINATDFASGLVKCFGFLEPMKYSEFKGLSEDKVDILYRDTAANIVALRKQRETDRLRVIYNKLKHPFLVKGTLPPELGRHAEKVGVLLTPSDPQDIASAISIPVDNSNLKLIFNNIVMIGVTIENSLIITLDTFKYHLSGRN